MTDTTNERAYPHHLPAAGCATCSALGYGCDSGDVYVVTADSTRDLVVAAADFGAHLETPEGEDLDPLYCPHCDLWIGDPDWTGIEHVSIDHDVAGCGDEAAGLLPNGSPVIAGGSDDAIAAIEPSELEREYRCARPACDFFIALGSTTDGAHCAQHQITCPECGREPVDCIECPSRYDGEACERCQTCETCKAAHVAACDSGHGGQWHGPIIAGGSECDHENACPNCDASRTCETAARCLWCGEAAPALGRCAMGVLGDQCPEDAVEVVDDWPMCARHADVHRPLRAGLRARGLIR